MKTIEGAPESITLAQVIAACEALGIDPHWARGLRIGDGWLEVTLHAFQPARIRRGEDRVTEHVICYDLLADPPADD